MAEIKQTTTVAPVLPTKQANPVRRRDARQSRRDEREQPAPRRQRPDDGQPHVDEYA